MRHLKLAAERSRVPMTEPALTPDDTDGRFLAQMDRELIGWADPVARLRAALEQDELELFSQPMQALKAPGGLPIAEVMVRLREEEQAMLPPGEFLPAFEHYEMMPDLDRWVVAHAVRHLGPGARIGRLSINVAAQTLPDKRFPAFVARQLAAAKLPGSALVFELEEADMLERTEVAAGFARPLRALGCGLLFDGFGRRSVSFAPLKTLGFEFVKVDGGIIRHLARSKMNAIVRVGEAIRVSVIGECIEDDATLELVRSVGADLAQGFGIARPAPIAAVLGA
jgi:EAL domain-containing protein (putative c-di-GMP-specific phosphodiesterase class I)